MGGALITTGFSPGIGVTTCGFAGGNAGTPFADQRGTLDRDATVRLEMSCGNVAATRGDGDAWTVTGSSDDGRPPDIGRGDGSLSVIAPERRGVALASAASSWNVTLPGTRAVSLELAVNAGSAEVDLAGMLVPALDASVNAGDVRVDLSGTRGTARLDASANAGSLVLLLPVPDDVLRGSISVNAGSATICAPDGVGVRLEGDASLGSIDAGGRGLVHDGDTWTTPGYASAERRIDLSVDANLGSITLDAEDGCD
jgi:hypothetical protein